MEMDEFTARRAEAAEQLNQQQHRDGGAAVAGRLGDGLTMLRDAVYARCHTDIQERFGSDSMLAPLSEQKSEKLAKLEIELYLIAVSALTARERRYVAAGDEWYLQWLSRLRLGRIGSDAKVSTRLSYYLSKTPDGRRLAFTNVLAGALPESRRVPLVLFHLVPLAVRIVTARAFGDQSTAAAARSEQVDCLPAISDCVQCHGKLLEDGQQCRCCGNPLWKFQWLTATG